MNAKSASLVACALLSACTRAPSDRGAPNKVSSAGAAATSVIVPARNGVTLCTVRGHRVVQIAASVDAATGDTLIDGRPIPEVISATQPPYIAQAEWYRKGEPVLFRGREWITDGYPAIRLQASDAEYIGEYRGAPIFQEVEQHRTGKIYLLLSPACLFQPFDSHDGERPTRGLRGSLRLRSLASFA